MHYGRSCRLDCLKQSSLEFSCQIISSKRINLRSDRGWALGCSASAKDAVVQIRSSKRADKEEEEH
jgi:hypothetical protein